MIVAIKLKLLSCTLCDTLYYVKIVDETCMYAVPLFNSDWLSLCSSRKYLYLPHRGDFFSKDSPPPFRNSNIKLHTFL